MLKFAGKKTNSWYMQIRLAMELFRIRAICICDNYRKLGKGFEYVWFYFRLFFVEVLRDSELRLMRYNLFKFIGKVRMRGIWKLFFRFFDNEEGVSPKSQKIGKMI
jgi:hypothetical protein